jgi:hypothetical protein
LYKQGGRTHTSTKLDVAGLVADDEAVARIEVKISLSLLDEAGPGLAADAAVLGTMRARIDAVDGSAFRGEESTEATVNLLEAWAVNQASADHRLVREDNHTKPEGSEPLERVPGSGNQLDLCRICQMVLLVDQRAVSIE